MAVSLFVARTYLFDECIKRHVEQGYDMIVNRAAGLDAMNVKRLF